MRILLTGGSGFIGTNLVDRLRANHQILDLSHRPPLNLENMPFWRETDILDQKTVQLRFREFQPEIVIHLAARAECDECTTIEKGYRVNTDGTSHVLKAICETRSVRRTIITSSQFVCGPGRLPRGDDDYFPVTVYGASKVITEELTRRANLPCPWTIIRPTNIWGPWHERYSREFWRIVAQGLYVHPAGAPVVRCYGYIGTVMDQIENLLNIPAEEVNGKTLYVGDAADDIYLWANAFCLALTGRRAPRVPRTVLRTAGLVGDLITTLSGKPFYITSSRYRSMVSEYLAPMEPTFDILGRPARVLDKNVQETVSWLRSKGPSEFSNTAR